MKFNLIAEFDSLADLVDFYEKVRKDLPPLSGNHITVKPLPGYTEDKDGNVGWVSMADPEPKEEWPTEELKNLVEETNEAIEQAKEPAKPAFNMTRDQVKLYCATARTEKNVNIKKILIGLGATSFTALPDEKLEELYDAVKLARGD